MQAPQLPVILRRDQVQAATGYSRSTIYLRISQGLWPRPISLGARSVGWPDSEVAALNRARIAGLTEQAIRSLVHQLEGLRSSAFTLQDAPGFARVAADGCKSDLN